jgi:hypothetical protein
MLTRALPWSYGASLRGDALISENCREACVEIVEDRDEAGRVGHGHSDRRVVEAMSRLNERPGLAQVERPRNVRSWIESQLYEPRY